MGGAWARSDLLICIGRCLSYGALAGLARRRRDVGDWPGQGGGSIGGCAAAVSLSRRGWDVELFERSDHELVARGAGIATFTPFLDALVDRDLDWCGSAPLRCTTDALGRPRARSLSGRLLGSDPLRLPMSTLTWGDLYTQLRRRVSARRLCARPHRHRNRVAEQRRALRLAEGRRHYDLVVCADGYR